VIEHGIGQGTGLVDGADDCASLDGELFEQIYQLTGSGTIQASIKVKDSN